MTTSHSSLDDGQIVKTADSLSHSLPVIKTTDQGAPTDPTAIQTTTTTTTMQEQLLDQTQTEQIREQQNVVQPQQQRTMGSSKKSWIEKRDRMFAKSGYVSLEQMPEELPESALKENTRVLTGRKIGKMEMIKARKEYRKKREVAIRRQRTMDAYYDTINQEEMEIRATKEMNALRDEWDAIHVLDTKEERQQFMEDAVSGDRQRILSSLMKVFVKLNEVDLNIFTYHNEEEMYQNYEQKMRYINAGHVLRSMVAKYISLGGAFENATYQKLQALSSFYEGLEYAYSSNKLTRQNPQYLLMRDSDYQKLTTKRIAQSEEDVKKAKDKHKAANGEGSDPEKRLENVENFLQYVLQERGMLGDSEGATKELRVKLEIKEKTLEKLIKDNKKKNGKNAPDTNDIKITRRGVEGLRLRIQRRESGEEAEPGSAYMQPGETAPAYYERMADIRRNMSAKAWTANLTAVKDILSAEVKYANKLYPKGTLHETKNGPWVRAGAGHRMTTRMSMVELTYMKRTGKSYEELIRLHEKAQKDGYPEDFIAVRDEIEGIIAGQKKLTGQGEEGESGDHSTADPQDVQKLAGIMEEMIRGFLLQFSTVGKKDMFKQFLGISDPMNTVEWKKAISVYSRVGFMLKDIEQLAENDEAVSRLAFSRLTAEELKDYRVCAAHAESVSACVQQFKNILDKEVLYRKDGNAEDDAVISEDVVRKIANGVPTDVHNPMYDPAVDLQYISMFLQSLSAGETKTKTGLEERKKQQENPAPVIQRTMPMLGTGLGDFAFMMTSYVSSRGDVPQLAEAIYGPLGDEQRAIIDRIRVTGDKIVDTSAFKITVEQDGTVAVK